MRETVLRLPVDVYSRSETMSILMDWIKKDRRQLRVVVTAYSEFYVLAQSDSDFFKIIKKADLVTPDGVSVLAAVRYGKSCDLLKMAGRLNVFTSLIEGLKVGVKIVRGELGETVTGVWLFENLAYELNKKKNGKIFILGGWGGVAQRTAEKLGVKFPYLRVMWDEGEARVGEDEQTNERVVKKINNFKPDVLFVAYNPVKQEKWIAKESSRLKAGIAMGVGGTFNEFVGELSPVPIWMSTVGLKWLWRLWLEPSRWRRVFRAVIVFPWLVFKQSLKD